VLETFKYLEIYLFSKKISKNSRNSRFKKIKKNQASFISFFCSTFVQLVAIYIFVCFYNPMCLIKIDVQPKKTVSQIVVTPTKNMYSIFGT